MTLSVERLPTRFYPDTTRVIARHFMPGGRNRIKPIVSKILELSDEEVRKTFHQVLVDFSERHRSISSIFKKHFNLVKKYIAEDFNIDPDTLSMQQQLLIGSYFSMEYSIESAAFFNPSIVEDPNQNDLELGQKRVIISFRATGEGHISSIVFRSGIIQADNTVVVKPVSRNVDIPECVERHVYDKKQFLERIEKLPKNQRKNGDTVEADDGHTFDSMKTKIMDLLGEKFIFGELQAAIEEATKGRELNYAEKSAINAIKWLARSHYEFAFSYDTALSERVIFPVSYTESNGIEDARFVRFTDDDGEVTFYATYTAYSGYSILPKLLETKDFYSFKVSAINGHYAQDKGMALFPRRVNGKYVMLSRLDGYNNYVMFSDKVSLWDNCQKVQVAKFPWEFSQLGNCGSPIETEIGWLVITHGVGPMRRYCLGAVLLDLEDPTKVKAYLKEPLLAPNEEEREGYVPNVVYTCGAMTHNNRLVIPYAMSDYASTIGTIALKDVFDRFIYCRK